MKFFSRFSPYSKGLFLSFVGIFFMTSGIAITRFFVVHNEISSYNLFFWTTAGALLFSFPLFFYKRTRPSIGAVLSEHRWVIVYSGISLGMSSVLYFFLIQNIPSDTIALFEQSTVFWSVLLGVIFLQERIWIMQIVSLLLCTFGMFLVYQSEISLTPMLLLLLSINPFFYALHSFVIKKYAQGISGISLSFYRLLLSFILFGGGMVMWSPEIITFPGVYEFCVLGGAGTIGLVWGRAVITLAQESLPLSDLNLLFLLMPILLLLATPLIEVGYVFDPWKYIGAGMVIVGMVGFFLWKKGR